MKDELLKLLHERDIASDDAPCIIDLLTKRKKDYYKEMIDYIKNNNPNKDSIYRYAFKITKTKFDEFIIVD